MLTNFKWTKKEWTGPFQYKNEDLGEGTFLATPFAPLANPFLDPPELMMLPTSVLSPPR